MRLVFFGDSICFGQHVSPHLTWVHGVSQRLCSEKLNLHVSNSSISGNTTRMALERYQFDVLAHGLDAIYIQFGLNDCNYWETDKGHPRVSQQSFLANLKEIIDRARMCGCKKVYVATNHPTLKTENHAFFPESYQKSNQRYNELIREVANSEQAELIDHELFWEEQLASGEELNKLLLKDGIHLSERGHELYLKFCINRIKPSEF